MANGSTEKTIVRTGGGSGAVWFVAGIVVVALGLGAYFLMGGEMPNDENELNINVDLPGKN